MKSVFWLMAALVVASSARSHDLAPWRRGMSKDQVQSFKELGLQLGQRSSMA